MAGAKVAVTANPANPAARFDGVFANAKKPYNPNPTKVEDYTTDEFGMSKGMASIARSSEQMTDQEYWLAVARMSKTSDDAPDVIRGTVTEPEVLHEGGSIDTPNPVNASAKGQDNALVVTPSFAGGEQIAELIKLKMKLHDLTDKLAGAEVGRQPLEKAKDSTKKPGQDVMKKIHALMKQIDELSNDLIPGTVEKDAQS